MEESSLFVMHGSSSTENLISEIRKPSKVRSVQLFGLVVFLLTLSIVFIVLYVEEKNDDSRPNLTTESLATEDVITEAPKTGQKVCSSPECVMSSSDILKKLDTSVKACDDFYQYSCGGFVKNRHIGDEQSALTSFTITQDFVEHSLKNVLEDKKLMLKFSQDPNSAVYKALTFYNSCMNESEIETTGTKPMIEVLQKYGLWSITNQTQTHLWKLEKVLARVFVDLGSSVFISLDVKSDISDTSKVVFWIGEGKSGLIDEKPHIKHLSADGKVEIRKRYKKLISRVFQLLGKSPETSNAKAKEILDLEIKFAKLKRSSRRKSHLKFMTLDELNKFTSFKFDWKMYFQEVLRGTDKSIKSYQKVLVWRPYFIKDIINLLHKKLKRSLVDVIMWNVVHSFINSLPKSFREAKNEYLHVLTGIDTPKPRWRTCGSITNTVFEYATALIFANKYLSEDARKRAEDLISEIKEQFVDGLEEQTWMDNTTRDRARDKLNAMKQSVGYPSFIKDPIKLNKMYEGFNVSPRFDFLQNQLNISKAQILNKVDQFGKAPDRTRFVNPPVGVNAFYVRRFNKMNVLMGILQKPFYESNRLKALNYAGIGVFIGHEITHGFDVLGIRYDDKGNRHRWCTDESRHKFDKRSRCLAKQYSNTYVFGRKVNGYRTLSENIADNGGLKYAFRAYRKWRDAHGEEDKLPALGRFTNDQLFFIGYAQTWCSKYRDEKIDILMSKDKHSLNPDRVRVPLSNFPEFHKAFGCKAPEKICTLW